MIDVAVAHMPYAGLRSNVSDASFPWWGAKHCDISCNTVCRKVMAQKDRKATEVSARSRLDKTPLPCSHFNSEQNATEQVCERSPAMRKPRNPTRPLRALLHTVD